MIALPNHIFIWGLPGAGKSTALAYLKHIFPFPSIDLDQYISEKENSSIPEIFDQKGESGFREIEKESLSTILKTPAQIIATGGGTPCFGNNAALMLQNGISIWLDVPLDQLLLQLDGSFENRPLFHTLSTDQRRTQMQQLFTERVGFYQQAHFKIKVADGNGWLPGLAALIWDLALQSRQNTGKKAFE